MNYKVISSVLKEYGTKWAVNRGLYSVKQKIMSHIPGAERFFEKKVGYPIRLNLFSYSILRIRAFLKELPKDKQAELTKLANNACEGKIRGFSSVELAYGNPINWQLNPLTSKECDITKKWYQIPDFDPERGDIKVTWEASRFSHFITLARAYLLTGDEKYYNAFSEQLVDWIESNPYPFGANFKCGQECSLRMVNGLMAYTVFKDCGITTDVDKRNIETLILRCYRKVCSNFFYAYKCIKNNHTISELMGMIVGSWCCGEDEQLEYAFRILNEVIDEQFTVDGGYIQHSFNYQRLALQDVELILSIEDRIGYKLSKQSCTKLLNAAKLMYQCQDESGDMPNYGANDGALAFPVTSCEYKDFSPVINTVHAIITGKRIYDEGLYDEELLWFGNACDYPISHKSRVSKAFNQAGLFTLRTQDSWGMVVLNDYKSRPAHMDQLHFDLWIDGVNVLCDGGSYSYSAKEGHLLVSNTAHNTVQIIDMPQMNIHGAFMVYGWTKRGSFKHTDRMFYGRYKSQNGYVHHRIVEIINSGYRIMDRVEANREYLILFHTPCEVVMNKGSLELKNDGKVLCKIKSTIKGETKKTFRSLYYLKKDEITCIEFSASEMNTVVTDIEVVNRRDGKNG